MATFTNTSKNASTWVNQDNRNALSFLTTDTPDYVLVGENEDEFLVLWENLTWANLAKN